jgi:hypothetical protein
MTARQHELHERLAMPARTHVEVTWVDVTELQRWWAEQDGRSRHDGFAS